MFQEGQQIGTYTLIRKLGKGGFGEVWLSEKRSQLVTKKVALKLPHEDQINIAAIRQEAELWEQASGHPNVLPIIDADVINGQVVIVSEYAEGGSLHDKLKNEGKLSIEQSVEMTIGILNGLEFLHNKRIIHRDIKPQNILLQGKTPRLADFGISRAVQTTAVSSTIIGTDAYMSPESFDGKRTVQTDIWSVGVVLYQLLAQTLPFPQEHPSERMFAIFSKEFAPLNDQIPSDLKKIVSRALAKLPENRYLTTTEMRDELQKALLRIAHPTFAPTELFTIPLEHLPPISSLIDPPDTEIIEKETIVSPKNNSYPAPSVPDLQPDSIATNFRETPQITNQADYSSSPETLKTPAAKFQMFGKPLKSGDSLLDKLTKNRRLEYVIAGVVGIFLLVSLVFVVSGGFLINLFQKPTPLPTTNINIMPPSTPGSATKLNIEIRASATVALVVELDGKRESLVLSQNQISTFSPENKFKISYYKDSVDQIQLKVEGKIVALPKIEQTTSNLIEFEVTKNNLARILQNSADINQGMSNTSTNSNSMVNPSPTSSVSEMNIEFTATEPVAFFIRVDGGKEDSVVVGTAFSKKVNPQNNLEMRYSPEKSSIIKLKINGKSISIPNYASTKNSMTKLLITKDHLNEILASGKITLTY